MKFSELSPEEQVAQVMVRLYWLKLTDKAGGNVSFCDRETEQVYITPTGKHKGRLERGDISVIDMGGKLIRGKLKTSSETPFHLRLYNEIAGLNSIVHAHPHGLLSFSLLHQLPPVKVIAAGGHKLLRNVGRVGYEMPGEDRLADIIAAAFREGKNPLIMDNHAGLAGGGSLLGAYKRFETLEYCARMCLYAMNLLKNLTDEERAMNPSLRLLTEQQFRLHDGLGDRKFEECSHTITEQEARLRKEICDYVRSAYDRTVMMSTTGSFSARYSDGFLITPHGEDRLHLNPDDIVFVRGNMVETGKLPSWYARLHESIYSKHPNINSIATAQPPYLMAYAITGVEPIYVKDGIPEDRLLLREFPSIKFDALFSDEVADTISLSAPAVLVQNYGVVAAGRSVESVYTILECAEPTAQAVNDARIGTPFVLNRGQITALETKFIK